MQDKLETFRIDDQVHSKRRSNKYIFVLFSLPISRDLGHQGDSRPLYTAAQFSFGPLLACI